MPWDLTACGLELQRGGVRRHGAHTGSSHPGLGWAGQRPSPHAWGTSPYVSLLRVVGGAKPAHHMQGAGPGRRLALRLLLTSPGVGWEPVLLNHPGLAGLKALRRWAGHQGSQGPGALLGAL